MKSLTAFSQTVLQDLGDQCGISTDRDWKTITIRVKHEGFAFLGITLSNFGKDFQKGLDQGFVAHNMFAGFQRHGGLPRFLGGFLELAFDRGSGLLLEEPSLIAIRAVHQITQMFGKVETPCSDARITKAFNAFIECEQDLRTSDSKLVDDNIADFVRVGSVLFGEMFSKMDLMIYHEDILPKHGSGAVAEKLTSNSKYSQNEWTERLEDVFSFGEMLFPNHGWYKTYRDVAILEPGNERPVRVVHVPKTLKTPRIIAIEPTCMQYVQQGLMVPMTDLIQRDDSLRTILGNLDQEPNRLLAREGSQLGNLATLDLSEASDRVSNQLVRALLGRWSHLHGAVDSCRSRTADVPGHGVVRLAKFASMGSALTFLMEGIVFTTIVFLAIERASKRPVTKGLIREHLGRVRIYGDDIIVPVDMVHPVIELLETFGLKVNSNKSFWTGKFRESCGGDYYNGHDITLVRVRREFPTSREHVAELVSTVSLRNQLFERGFEHSVEYLDKLIGEILPIFPEVPRTSNALGRWSHSPIQADGTDRHYHRPFVKAYVVKEEIPRDPLDDRGALMKHFLKISVVPNADKKHLQRAGRSRSSRIQTGRVYV